MKCIRNVIYGGVWRTSEKHAAKLVTLVNGGFEYAPKQEWKAGGRLREGPLDGAPISDHPRNGSPPRHGKRRR